MSLARNFAAGQQIAQNAMDTFRDARQRRDLGRIADARPEEFDGFTQADGDQLRAMSQAINPETGQPYYDVQDNGRGGLQVRNNFSFAGQDGQMVDPGSITGLQPRRVTEFLGQRREGSLTPEQIDSMRSRAMADVISRADPVTGLRMRREANAEDREGERFGWDRQRQPLTQRAAELQVDGAERAGRAGQRVESVQEIVDNSLRIPQEQIGPQLMQYLNTNQSDLPLIVLSTNKDGLQVAERNPMTGEIMPPFNIPYSVGQKLVAGMALQQAGKGAEAIQLLSNVDERVTDLISRYNGQALDVARFNNDAAFRGAQMDNDRARLGIAQAGLRMQQNQAENANWQLIGASDDGRGLLRYNRNTGAVESQPLPEGVDASSVWRRVSGAQPDISVEKLYEQLVGTQVPGQRRGVVYTPETALSEARRIAGGRQDPIMEALDRALGGGGDPFAAPSSPAAPRTAAPAPAARALTPFEQRRADALAQETARKEQERAAREAASEAERMRRLEQRPDLQNLGGMRFYQ